MRRFTIDGRKYKLTEQEYKILLERFDVNNANERGIIEKKCICPVIVCSACDLGPARENCLNILKDAIGAIPTQIKLHRSYICFTGEEGKQYINKVREALLSLPKTR